MRAYIAFMDRLSDALAVVAGVMLFVAVVVICWMVPTGPWAIRPLGAGARVFMMVCSLSWPALTP